MAHAQDARIVAIADSPQSPIGRLAHHLLLSPPQGYAFPDATTGAQMIGHILVGLVVTSMGAVALQRISANEALVKKTGELE